MSKSLNNKKPCYLIITDAQDTTSVSFDKILGIKESMTLMFSNMQCTEVLCTTEKLNMLLDANENLANDLEDIFAAHDVRFLIYQVPQNVFDVFSEDSVEDMPNKEKADKLIQIHIQGDSAKQCQLLSAEEVEPILEGDEDLDDLDDEDDDNLF